MRRAQPLFLAIPLLVVVAATAFAIWATDNQVWGTRTPPFRDWNIGATGTAGDLPSQVPATVGTPLGELSGIGGPDELTALIGQRVQFVIDIRQAIHDVAFWIGWPPDDLLAVLDRDTRSGLERQLGRPSEAPFGAVSGGEYITVNGVIVPVPYPEAMFSWGLTRRDAALLEERGVYVRVDKIVSPAPHLTDRLTAEEVDEWGRETAPPPGEQVETELGLPPPKP